MVLWCELHCNHRWTLPRLPVQRDTLFCRSCLGNNSVQGCGLFVVCRYGTAGAVYPQFILVSGLHYGTLKYWCRGKKSTVGNSDLFHRSVSSNATDLHRNVNLMRALASNKFYRFNYHSLNQQMHTVRYNHNNVRTLQFVHVSALNGSAQWHKTIV